MSLAESSRRDMAALGAAAISYPIEDIWRTAVESYGYGWQCETWPEGTMILVAPDAGMRRSVVYAVNSNTGAWCEFTGWRALTLLSFGGDLFFGTSDGVIKQAWTTGSDDGVSYVGQYIPLFDDFGLPGVRKVAHMARVVWRAAFESIPTATARFEYDASFPPPPPGSPTSDGNLWGSGLWGSAKWSSEFLKKTFSRWISVGGSGDKASVAVQFTSGSVGAPDVEIVEVELSYTAGDIGA